MDYQLMKKELKRLRQRIDALESMNEQLADLDRRAKRSSELLTYMLVYANLQDPVTGVTYGCGPHAEIIKQVRDFIFDNEMEDND